MKLLNNLLKTTVQFSLFMIWALACILPFWDPLWFIYSVIVAILTQGIFNTYPKAYEYLYGIEQSGE